MKYRGPTGNNATAIFAALALIAFVALYGYLIYAAIRGFAPSRIDNELATTLIAGLAGLVGGVVTVAIGKPPPETSPEATTEKRQPQAGEALAGETSQAARTVLIWAYLICYIAMGALAIVTAIVWADYASEPLRNLAGIFVGLALPAARGFFS
jgi:cobalamin synthase